MIIFFSSGATPRYRDDIIRILALPSGGELQFRYDQKYLEENLRAQVTSGALVDQAALVCFLASDKSKLLSDYVPCRFATIVQVEQIGSSTIVRLRVEKFANELDGKKLRSLLSQDEQKLLPAWDNASGSEPTRIGRFVFSSGADFAKCSSDKINAFEAIALALSKCEDFSDHSP